MEKPLRHWLVASDIDGTLIDPNGMIPKRNLDAIKELTAQGGKFALATGRSIPSTRQYARKVPGCNYAILYNGSLIYDFEREKILYEKNLPKEAYELALLLHDKFDTLCIEVYTHDGIYCNRNNEFSDIHFTYEGLSYEIRSLDAFPRDGWIKAVFVDAPEKMKGMRSEIKSLVQFDSELVISDQPYYELLPKNCTKGTALCVLADFLSIPIDRTAAIGDYYNDRELLAAAGIAGVPNQAPPEIQQMADVICSNCRDGAVADLIDFLARQE